ncbi:MAG: prealbumin-like fold domain-containing protein [Clostridiales bacterium]|nr:prealbumin-like fold domain-containing protein [Clostridiales bacterium]
MTYCYTLRLKGYLLEPEVKQYEDLRVIDLLPDGVHYAKIYMIQQGNTGGPILDGGTKYQPEIIENYYNSGRTAVIFHLNAENLKKSLDVHTTYTDIYFGVTIDQDAHPGKVRNYVYAVGDNLEEYQNQTGGTEDIYDLNNKGQNDDKIAYGYSDATIIAAQSIYAEKFIAPDGSNNWSKQGLLVKTGTNFDYLLKITNETKTEYSSLVVYDTLPHSGDKNVFGTQDRSSEFDIHLRGVITPPKGYSVYYTTSTDVYQKSIEGTALNGESAFEVRIPAQAPNQLDDASMAKLHEKTSQDQTSGTATWLEANNSFGFITTESPSVKESNTVWARIPFAGFCVKKVDGTSDSAVSGAEFELTDAEGQVVATATSGEDGTFSFRELTEGRYTLTETKVPEGYMDRKLSITVTITQNPVTMEYNISFGDRYPGVGSSEDPLCLPNDTTPVLPSTGGAGRKLYTAGGALLIAAAACLLYIQNKRRRGAQTSD